MIIEDENLLSDKEKDIITNHLYKIPFTFINRSTTEKFPFYAHNMVSRPPYDLEKENKFSEGYSIKIKSEYFSFYRMLLDRFCSVHGIKYRNIIRSCINSTYYFPDYNFLDPHIDFSQKHLVILLYMNDVKVDKNYNNTIVFDLEYSDGKPFCYDLNEHPQDEFSIKKEVIPKLGKFLCFDGKYYHANKFPFPGQNRFVCVFNLLI
jgi:hypothetical protein